MRGGGWGVGVVDLGVVGVGVIQDMVWVQIPVGRGSGWCPGFIGLWSRSGGFCSGSGVVGGQGEGGVQGVFLGPFNTSVTKTLVASFTF